MLDSIKFPQHCFTKDVLCGPKLTWFRNSDSSFFSHAYVSSCVNQGEENTCGRRAVHLAGTRTFPWLQTARILRALTLGRWSNDSAVWRWQVKVWVRWTWVCTTLSGDWDLYPGRSHIWAHFTNLRQREVREKSFQLVTSLKWTE